MGNPAQIQTQATPPAVLHAAAMKPKQRTNRNLPLPTLGPTQTSRVTREVAVRFMSGKPRPKECTTRQLFDIVFEVAQRFRTAKEIVAQHKDYILRLKSEVFKVRFGSFGVRVPVKCRPVGDRPQARRMLWKEFCEEQFGVSADWIHSLCSGKAEATKNSPAVEKPTNGGTGLEWNTILTNLVNALEPCGDSLPLLAKHALEAARELLEGEKLYM